MVVMPPMMMMVVAPAMVVMWPEVMMVSPAVMVTSAVVAPAVVMVMPAMVMVMLNVTHQARAILHRDDPARCHRSGGSGGAERQDGEDRQSDQGKGARHGISSSMRNERPARSP
jgi:hypothetical protein